jgi:hypothetical protein
MPLLHIVNEVSQLVVITGLGKEALPEAEDSLAQLLRDPVVRPGFRFLILVHPAAVPPASDEVPHFAALLGVLLDQRAERIALVTSGAGHATPAQLMTMSIGDPRLRAFMNEHEAREWLLAGAA